MQEMIYSAATVLLVREGSQRASADGSKLEVYLNKRPSTMRFLAGHYVFPGGKMDEQDHDPELLHRCAPVPDVQNPERLPLSFWVTGLRELFEEAGMLLARDRQGRLVQQEPFDAFRESVLQEQGAFLELIRRHDLTLATDLLRYFGHRLTPRKVSRARFATRFFLASLPEGMEPVPHREEVAAAAWYDPETALAGWAEGRMPMVPPTVDALRVVSRYRSFEELWRSPEGVGNPTPEELE